MTTYDNIFHSLGVVTGSALVKDKKKKEKVLACSSASYRLH